MKKILVGIFLLAASVIEVEAQSEANELSPVLTDEPTAEELYEAAAASSKLWEIEALQSKYYAYLLDIVTDRYAYFLYNFGPRHAQTGIERYRMEILRREIQR